MEPPLDQPDSKVKAIQDFINELSRIDIWMREIVDQVIRTKEGNSLRARQAEWHIRGLCYHCRHLVSHYSDVASGVVTRVETSGANMLVMFAPSVQHLWHEFYALTNLARITLDNLRLFLAPTFATPMAQLPKSVADIMAGETDCPVYAAIRSDPHTGYLSDIRNCIVHHRTFATSDNTIISEEGCDTNSVMEMMNTIGIAASMARGEYRRTADNQIVVNFYLPDQIFIWDGPKKKMANFTYLDKKNLLSVSMAFVRVAAFAVGESLSLVMKADKPVYTYKKRSSKA